ncbi:hypothetical protein [Serratia odorifera]|uniref:hypothetical protein n=1 Tax=Serratia odorifera TaxID=618 RepID=UPI0018E8404A|nr:hypothetical protein [Serratia odorifera]MBJ2065666.1 hypothetical protein [Serratia odorifera]
MTIFYDQSLDYCVADVIAYATDPLLQDRLVELKAPAKDVFRAGSLIDSATGDLATEATKSEDLFVLLEKTQPEQETISAARPFGVELKMNAMLAADSTSLATLLPMLQMQGFGFHTCGVFTS